MLIKPLSRTQRWMLSLVLLSAVISAAQPSVQPQQVWEATLVWFLHVLLVGAICFIARADRGSFAWFWRMLVFGTFGYALLVVIFMLRVPDPSTFPWMSRLPGVTWVRHIGYFVAPALATLVAWHVSVTRPGARAVAAIALVILAAFGFWTGTRGIFFSLTVSYLITMFFIPALKDRRCWTIVLMAISLGAALSTQIPVPQETGFGIVARTSPDSYSSVSEMGSGRLELWQDTLRTIGQGSLVGYGAGKYRPLMAHYGYEFNHPHNFVLQIVFQWGPVGAIALFGLLAAGWLRSARVVYQTGTRNGPAFLVLNTLLAYSMIDGTGHYAFPLSIMGVALGYLLSQSKTLIETTARHGPLVRPKDIFTSAVNGLKVG